MPVSCYPESVRNVMDLPESDHTPDFHTTLGSALLQNKQWLQRETPEQASCTQAGRIEIMVSCPVSASAVRTSLQVFSKSRSYSRGWCTIRKRCQFSDGGRCHLSPAVSPRCTCLFSQMRLVRAHGSPRGRRECASSIDVADRASLPTSGSCTAMSTFKI